MQFFIGADWGETRSATVIIIAFEHEQEIQSPTGGIFYKYDFLFRYDRRIKAAVIELHLSLI